MRPTGTDLQNPDAALVGLTTHLLGLACERLERSVFLRAALGTLGRYANCDTVLLSLNTGTKLLVRGKTDSGAFSSVRCNSPFGTNKCTDESHSTALIPIEEDGESRGYLQFGRSQLPCFSSHEMAFLESLSQVFTIALKHWQATWSLQERVKELSCLYRIANVLDTPDKSIGEVLEEIAAIIPSAWLYSGEAASRIQFDQHNYCSKGYVEGKQEQRAEIIINGKKRGSVRVAYLNNKPELSEGPFLAEERKLLDTIAKELSLRIERRIYEEEQAKAKEQLRHSNRLAVIGQLAAAVAHELNEPLTNILGFAQLAAKEIGSTSRSSGDIEKIIANSLHAREIVRKLLLYGRKMPQQKAEVDINEVAQEALSLFEHRLSKDSIVLELNLAEDVKRIIADPSHLRQVVANLVLNSIHAMPHGGRLTVSSVQTNNNVELIVRDTGCGISEAIRDKVFIPFFTTKESGRGTGLGLTVVLEIVTGLGGSIQIDSSPGAGTVVLVSLPMAIPEQCSGDRGEIHGR